MLQEMVGSPGIYLVAFPRTELIEEKASWLRSQCAERPEVIIETFHSDQHVRGRVLARVETALRTYGQAQHAFILTTHETLLTLNPSGLSGWSLGIDENPEMSVLSGAFPASAIWSALAHQYRLDPIGDDRNWQVLPREGVERLKPSEIIKDAADKLTPFHKRVLSGHGVFVNIGDWEDAKLRRVKWWSAWTPAELIRECRSVVITGASFFSSLAYHATRWAHDGAINFEAVDVGQRTKRTGRPRVTIYYYTLHEGTTAWWRTDEGSRCLVQVSRWLENIGFNGYWSCNDEIRPYFRHRFPGVMCSPKLAGTNGLIEHVSCAYIYSNKAQDADNAILEVLDLDRKSIKRTRETEDLIQFVMRGAIRRPDFDGAYDVHLYSLDQAEVLKKYLIENGVTDDVAVTPVSEAGIMDVRRPETERSRKRAESQSLTPKERRERTKAYDKARSQARRDKKKEEDAKNGLPPPKLGRRSKSSIPDNASQPKQRTKPREGRIIMNSAITPLSASAPSSPLPETALVSKPSSAFVPEAPQRT
ncbi:hypothetical protein ACFOYU_13135 [Microvirga sp. GCM10011540]|uniref:hypothetical protein n=1 Tax=Microvirga sp. GCM10011540 TaxID=3317338 RepID=UPI003616BA5A